MDDQRVHRDPAHDHSHSRPSNRTQTTTPNSTSGLYAIHHNPYAGGFGLPAMDFNTLPLSTPQGHALPEQYGYLGGAHVAPSYPHYGYSSLDLGSTFTQGPTRQSPSQPPLGSHHQARVYASAYDPSGIPAGGSQYPYGYAHLYHHPQSRVQAHDAEIAEADEASSPDPPTQPTGAPTSTHLHSSRAAPNENEALRFNSYAQAAAARDRSFRSPLQLVDDDVDEVERNKRTHVLSIVNALKHTECLPPPENRKGPHVRKGQQGTVEKFLDLNDNDKLRWQNWQEKAKQVVKVNLGQPNSDIFFEFRAWEVFEEMITIHRAGFLFTKQTIDIKARCSNRIEKAVQVLKDYAIVRSKLLDGQNISNFCISPEAYAKTTVSALWNNSNRPDKRKTGDTVTPGLRAKPATETGTIFYRYQPRPKRQPRKYKKSARSKVDDAVGAESSMERESQGAVLNESQLGSSLYADNDEEADEGEGEEEEIDEDDEAEEDDDSEEVIGGRDTERVRRILSGQQPSNIIPSSSFDDEIIGENLFGSLPGETRPLGQLDLDESTYPAPFGTTHTSLSSYSQSPEAIRSLSGTYGPPSWEAYSQGPAQASRTMLPSGRLDDGMDTGVNPPQRNMQPPRGLQRDAGALSGFPTEVPGHPWTGNLSSRDLPHSQDQQSKASKTRASKKRKL